MLSGVARLSILLTLVAAPVECQVSASAASLRPLLDSIRSDHALPGLVVVAARAGQITMAEAVGVRRLGRPEALRPEDPMHVGSVTKPVTASVVATLVESGHLDWHRTLAEIFPRWDVHPLLGAVTVEQLLRHRGGLQPFEEDLEFDAVPSFPADSDGRRQFAQWLLARPPSFTPGEHHYSNAGYTVLGVIAEHTAGRTWEALVEARILEPLGIRSGGFGWPATDNALAPFGHWEINGSLVPHPGDDPYQLASQYLGPAGDLYMSMVDLVRFGQAHLRGLQGHDSFVRAETFVRLHDAPVGEYASGWNVRSFGNHHLGGAGTFSAALIVMPSDDVVIAVATNRDADIAAIASRLIGRIRDAVVGSGGPTTAQTNTSGDLIELRSRCGFPDPLSRGFAAI